MESARNFNKLASQRFESWRTERDRRGSDIIERHVILNGERKVGKFPPFEVPKHCPLVLLAKYVREKVNHWEVKKVKR
jgi:hypothetical protein